MQRDPASIPHAELSDSSLANPADDLEDAHRSIEYAGTWINNADTKAGLLSAALAIVIAATAQQHDAIGDVLRPGSGGEWGSLVVLAFLGVAVAVAIVALALVITPRTPPPQAPSRFGFPTVASHGWKHGPASRAQAAAEAWEQARVLSQIASRKYSGLRVASMAVFAALTLYLTWIVASSAID